MGRLENVSYDTWWEYWNGMENMNHVMRTCSLEPISTTATFSISTLCACLRVFIYISVHQYADFVFGMVFFCSVRFFLHFCKRIWEAVAITNCDDFSSHNISLQFTLWFRHVLCGDSALFSHILPPSGVCSIFFYISNTNLKLPFER